LRAGVGVVGDEESDLSGQLRAASGLEELFQEDHALGALGGAGTHGGVQQEQRIFDPADRFLPEDPQEEKVQ